MANQQHSAVEQIALRLGPVQPHAGFLPDASGNRPLLFAVSAQSADLTSLHATIKLVRGVRRVIPTARRASFTVSVGTVDVGTGIKTRRLVGQQLVMMGFRIKDN